MITGLLLFILGLILDVILAPFVFASSFFNGLPVLEDAFTWIFGALYYFSGIINIEELLKVIVYIVGFMCGLWYVKALFWILEHIPFLNIRSPFNRKKEIKSEYSGYVLPKREGNF